MLFQFIRFERLTEFHNNNNNNKFKIRINHLKNASFIHTAAKHPCHLIRNNVQPFITKTEIPKWLKKQQQKKLWRALHQITNTQEKTTKIAI